MFIIKQFRANSAANIMVLTEIEQAFCHNFSKEKELHRFEACLRPKCNQTLLTQLQALARDNRDLSFVSQLCRYWPPKRRPCAVTYAGETTARSGSEWKKVAENRKKTQKRRETLGVRS
jgi:hypothetical protein